MKNKFKIFCYLLVYLYIKEKSKAILHIHQERRYQSAGFQHREMCLLHGQSRILPDLGNGFSWLQNIRGAFVIGELHQFTLCQHLMCMQISQASFQQLHLSRTPILGLRNTILVKEGFEQIIIFIYTYHLG